MTTPKTDLLATRASLLGRLKDWKDEGAWVEFNLVYGRLLQSFAIKLGVPEADAKDVVQETLMSVAKSIRDFEYDPARSSFKTWLLGVARRRVADYFRRLDLPRHAVHGSTPTADTKRTAMIERIPDPSGRTLENVWDDEWRNQVVELALERLKAQVRIKHFQIFYLRVIRQQPVAAVGKALGVGAGQVYLVTHRLNGTFAKMVAAVERELDGPMSSGNSSPD